MKVAARSVLVLSVLSTTPMAPAEAAWVLWAHSYELWVDKNKDAHRRDVTWKKVATTPGR